MLIVLLAGPIHKTARPQMQFDPDNAVVRLCAQGMEMESNQKPDDAKALFLQAWDAASNDLEKFIAAHYIARHQQATIDKLNWDEIALSFALRIKNHEVFANFPSLYLNIAKCHEDLGNYKSAAKNYQTALSYTTELSEDGYGKMIRTGIIKGLQRIAEFS
jgi:tetratricopeptide (TPR) repeat protein